MDQTLAELKAAVKQYRTAYRAGSLFGAFNWTIILTMLPALLGLFVTDPNLRNVISKMIQLLLEAFAPKAAEVFATQSKAAAATAGSPLIVFQTTAPEAGAAT
jgi:hypothetical protein